MADNMDEFEQENFDASEPPPPGGKGTSGGLKQSLTEAWRTQPLFKLMVIMIFVGLAIAGALGAFSSPPPVDTSKIVTTPSISEAPGGKASPYFIDQNKQANAERADTAIQQGGSAMPTPVGTNVDMGDLSDKKKDDPLAEFRAETDRIKQEMNEERQKNAQQYQVLATQVQQRPEEKEDDSLAQAMQRQMQQLMEAWSPKSIKVVAGTEPKDAPTQKQKTAEIQAQAAAAQTAQSAQSSLGTERTVVQAGTVNYAQLLTEANSDVPGPIMAQVLSGPFAGGRAIGHFQTMTDYLVIQFNLINYKGKDYPVNVLALNPDTTLGALVTDVDHRYFDRVILPAAASFVGQFGSSLGEGNSTTTVTENAVLVETARKSYKDALYSGLGQAGTSIAEFLQQEASQIKPLVRVATGTPMGLFFLTSVKETSDGSPVPQQMQQGTGMAGMYPGVTGMSAIPGYTGATQATNPYATNPYAVSPYGTTTGTYPNATGGYTYGTTPTAQKIPGTNVTIIPTGQTGLGTTYINR